MKDYKVGDTIYVRGKVSSLDQDGGGVKSYLVEMAGFGPLWIYNNDMVEEIPTAEPVKPVLPKDVAKELEITKKLNVTFDGYIMRVIDNHYLYTNSHTFWMNSDDGIIKTLLNAWYNGYTVEKEPTWYIEVPGKFNRPTYYAINDGALAFGYLDEDKKWYRDYSAHAFTNEEIKKYDLENFDKEPVTDD